MIRRTKLVSGMTTRGTALILVIAIVAASVIGILHATKKIDTAETLEMAALTTLVLITAWYAIQTATMADEMKRQRYYESLPLLVPTVPPILKTEELPYGSLQSGVGMKVMWCNMGKGTAINSRFYFYPVPASSGKAEAFPSHRLGTLEVGGKKEVDFDKIFERYYGETKLLDDKRWQQISNTYRPRLEAEYQDIYERKITTVQEFRIDEQNEKAFLGELYFTVNGRRLGEEAAQHD